MAQLKGKNATLTFDGAAVAQINTISWDGITNAVSEVKYVGGTSVVKVSADLPNYGKITLSLDWDTSLTSHAAIFAKYVSGAGAAVVFTLLSGGDNTFTGTAIVSDLTISDVAVGSVIKATAVLDCNEMIQS